MSNAMRNLIAFTVSLLAIAGVFGGLGYYIDKNFGAGVSAILGVFLVGVSLTLLTVVLVTFLNNRTHQSAGDDITSFHEATAKTQAASWQVRKEEARKDRELAGYAAKGELIKRKGEEQRMFTEWKEQRRMIAAGEQAAQDEADQADSMKWYAVENEQFVDQDLS